MRILLLVVLSAFIFAACSSTDSDAKEAAMLIKESINYTRSNELDKAKEAYDKAQAIMNRYKGAKQYEEFHKAYTTYLSAQQQDK